MKLIASFILGTVYFLMINPASATPPFNIQISDYKAFYYHAKEPFEVTVRGVTERCEDIRVAGEFTRLPATKTNPRKQIEYWIAEFSVELAMGPCRTDEPHEVHAKERLKITPKPGGQVYSFLVPDEVTLEFN